MSQSIYKSRSPVHRPTRAMTSDAERESLSRATARRAVATEVRAELDDILDDINEVLEDAE